MIQVRTSGLLSLSSIALLIARQASADSTYEIAQVKWFNVGADGGPVSADQFIDYYKEDAGNAFSWTSPQSYAQSLECFAPATCYWSINGDVQQVKGGSIMDNPWGYTSDYDTSIEFRFDISDTWALRTQPQGTTDVVEAIPARSVNTCITDISWDIEKLWVQEPYTCYFYDNDECASCGEGLGDSCADNDDHYKQMNGGGSHKFDADFSASVVCRAPWKTDL